MLIFFFLNLKYLFKIYDFFNLQNLEFGNKIKMRQF